MSKTSRSGNGGKRSGQRRATTAPATPAEALQLLQSAVSYCQQARMAVRAVNRPAGLALLVPEAHSKVHDLDGTVFLPGAMPAELERDGDVLPYGYRCSADGAIEVDSEQAERIRQAVRNVVGPRGGQR